MTRPERVLSCAEELHAAVDGLVERAREEKWSQTDIAEALFELVASRLAEKVSPAAAEAAVTTLQRKVAAWTVQ